MAVTLSNESKKQALLSLKRYCAENLDLQDKDFSAEFLLDFFLKEIAPAVYNGAVADAQAYLRDRVADLEGTCFEPEFPYWPRPPRS